MGDAPRQYPNDSRHGVRVATIPGDFVGSTITYSYSYVPESHSNVIASVVRGTQVTTNTWKSDRDVLSSKENKIGGTIIAKYE